jgi:hypothetical protein
MLSVLLYGFETKSVPLIEGLWVFENRGLKGIFGPKRGDTIVRCKGNNLY